MNHTTRPVYGIDLSLTGPAIAGPDGTDRIHTPGHTGDPLTTRVARIGHITDWVARSIYPHPLNGPDPTPLAVIEAPSYGSTGGQAHERAGLWWAVVDLCYTTQTEIIDITPGCLKKYATGTGTAQKSDMRMAMFKRSGIDQPDDNQVDAWWLRQIGLYLIGDPAAVTLPKTHTAGVDKLVESGKLRVLA